MSETKFTKGPWWVNFTYIDGVPVAFNVVSSEMGSVLPICESRVKDFGSAVEQLANANLMAAAPEMYAMLESLIGAYESLYFETYGDPIDKSEMEEEYRLLAKARGGK